MTEPSGNETWDSNLGVWVGSRASAIHEEDFPDPLYVFGYGSLIWRPGEFLEPLPSFHCIAHGYRRIFAQRSCDHRGTVEFPGVVLNLVSDGLLEKMGYILDANGDSGCQGLVWLVPQDKVQIVFEDLDYREKGGYSRHFISVVLKDSTPHHEQGSVVQALVYTGGENNPNFYLPSRLVRDRDEYADPFGLMRKSSVVDLISAAMGPSGPNTEYLFRLVSFLEDRQIVDDYLRNLSIAVQLRIGLARYRHLLPSEQREHLRGSVMRSNRVIGWGSNEFKQLSHTICPDLVHYPSPLFYGHTDSVSGLIWSETPYHYLFAGGASTAYLNAAGNVLHIWGKVCDQLRSQFIQCSEVYNKDGQHGSEHGMVIEGIAGAALGQEHSLLLLSSGFILFIGEERFQPNLDIILRPESLKLLPSKDITDSVFRFTHKVHVDNDCIEVADADLHKFMVPKHQITKLAVGLHHSVALAACGGVTIWGDTKYFPSVSLWRPESGAKVIDIACGARHVVIVDEQGVVYTVGSNKHGSLGRSGPGEREKQFINLEIKPVLLPDNIRFQRVCAYYYLLFIILVISILFTFAGIVWVVSHCCTRCNEEW
ncbi:hypothetical protein EON65_01235 [archaeon]|nr:MAG: hypothetical protein EON65_01235 [archaeon]